MKRTGEDDERNEANRNQTRMRFGAPTALSQDSGVGLSRLLATKVSYARVGRFAEYCSFSLSGHNHSTCEHATYVFLSFGGHCEACSPAKSNMPAVINCSVFISTGDCL